MQSHANQGFHDPLELEQCKGVGQQFEDDRAVLEFAAQASEGRGQDAPEILPSRAASPANPIS
jgi:hypothetical protein